MPGLEQRDGVGVDDHGVPLNGLTCTCKTWPMLTGPRCYGPPARGSAEWGSSCGPLACQLKEVVARITA